MLPARRERDRGRPHRAGSTRCDRSKERSADAAISQDPNKIHPSIKKGHAGRGAAAKTLTKKNVDSLGNLRNV